MKKTVHKTTKLGQSIRKSFLPISSSIASGFIIANPFLSSSVYAGPQGGHVIAGQAYIHNNGASTIIHQQSQQAAINWDSFNINANESVTFVQPSSSSAVLNRVINQNPTTILGKLNANGQIFIINPNGVIFGKTARVNVGGIVASGINIDTDEFMKGNYTFVKDPDKKPGQVINKGLIKAASSGVVLIGSNVMNEGRIYARLGNVAMVSANKVTIDFDGDGLIQFEVDKELIEKDQHFKQGVSNTGEIIAEGGHVILSASTSKDVFSQVVNNDGVIKASKIHKQGGDVFLLGGSAGDIVNTGDIDVSALDIKDDAGNIIIQGQKLKVSGQLLADAQQGNAGTISIDASKTAKIDASVSAQGKQKNSTAGKVHVSANKIELKSNTDINVSGVNGGGEVLVGGDVQGKGNFKTAEKTRIKKGAKITADAVISGKGGKVIIWADNKTEFKGDISAQGGKKSGDGGFVEVSGKKKLKFDGEVNTLAEQGDNGVLLLDPEFIKVVEDDGSHHGSGAIFDWLDNTIEVGDPADDNITITEQQLEDIDSDIFLQASVGIEFEAFTLDLDHSLTLETRNDTSFSDETKQSGNIHGIDISLADVNISNGSLTLKSGVDALANGTDYADVNIKVGSVNVSDSVNITSSGQVSLQDNIQAQSDINLNSGADNIKADNNITLASGNNININNAITAPSNNLDLIADTSVNLIQTDAQSLSVQTSQLNLGGNINTQGNINLSNTDNIILHNDVSLKSNQDIQLGTDITGANNALEISADIINIKNTQLKDLTINANNLNLDGNLNTQTLNVNNLSNLQVNGTRTIDTSSANSSINLSQTQVQGDDLTLKAGSGNITLGSANLDSLRVYAQSAQLNNNITTRYDLNLNNIITTVLGNNIRLRSIEENLFLNTNISGSYALNLDANNIELSSVNTDNLVVERAGSTTNLSGNIQTQDGISFASNTRLNLLENTILTSNANIELASLINGGYELTIDSQSANITLDTVNVETLTVKSSGITELNGYITAADNIDFSAANNLVLNNNVSMQSLQSIDLSGGISGVGHALQLSANDVNLGDAQLGGFSISADTLNINGDLYTTSTLNFSNLNNLQVNGNRSIDTSSTDADIMLTQTNISGDDLALKAGNGNIALGSVNLDNLSVSAQSAQLNNNITTRYDLDLNNVNTTVLANNINLRSSEERLLLNTSISGLYALTLNADNIYLSDINTERLTISKAGSTTNLSGNIQTQTGIDFVSNTSLNLGQNTSLNSNGDINLAENVNGHYQLSINSQTGDVSLGNINTESLQVSSEGITELNGDITTHDDIDLSGADNVVLDNNVQLQSNESINIALGIDGSSYTLGLTADDAITLGDTQIQALNIDADVLNLNGDISSASSIDFSALNTLHVNGAQVVDVSIVNGNIQLQSTRVMGDELSLKAGTGDIELGQVDLDTLTVQGETISLGDTQLQTLSIAANTLNLNGDLDSASTLDFNNLAYLQVNGNRIVDTSSNDNSIFLQNTFVQGDDLTLDAGNGQVRLGHVSLDSLRIFAGNGYFYHDVSTRYALDLKNISTVILENALTMSSEFSSIDLLTTLDAQGYDLTLDAMQIKLADMIVNNLSVDYTGSVINLDGDISALGTIDFSDSSLIDLNKDIDLVANNILLSEQLQGNYRLGLDSANIELGLANVNELDIKSPGNVFINNNVSTDKSLDLTASQLVLNNNASLYSDEHILLGNNVDANNKGLSLYADTVQISSINNLQQLDVTAQRVELLNDINATQSINLSNVDILSLSTDINLSAADSIYLPDTVDSQSIGMFALNLSSDQIFANELGQPGAELREVTFDSIETHLDGSIKTTGQINFNNTDTLYLDTNLSLDSSLGDGSVFLSQSSIDGYALTIHAGQGDIELGQADVKSIITSSRNLNLNNVIESDTFVDFSQSDNVNMGADVAINASDIDLKTNINGNGHVLTLGADSVSLGQVNEVINLDVLSITQTNSQLDLYSSLNVNNLDFASDSKMNLHNAISITTSDKMILADEVSGNYLLSLNNTGTDIYLNRMDVAELIINNSGVTHLSGNIHTESTLNIQQSSDIELLDDIKLSSQSSDLHLAADIKGDAFTLDVQADNKISVENIDVNDLIISSRLLEINGDSIKAEHSIDLTGTQTTYVTNNISFETDSTYAGTSQVQLNDLVFTNSLSNLNISADEVSIKGIAANNILGSLIIDADSLHINQSLSAKNSIELKASEIYLHDDITIASTSGILELSSSTLYGNKHNLQLLNTNGDINIGNIDNVNNLFVSTSGIANLGAYVNTYKDQDYRGVASLRGSTINLYSETGTIYLNNVNAQSLSAKSWDNINLTGVISTTNDISLVSDNRSITMTTDAKLYSNTIELDARTDISLSYMKGQDMTIRSSQGSLNIIPIGSYNIEGDTIRFNVKNDIASYLSPVYINVNQLIIESATNAIVNGQFYYQEIQGDTRLSMPELEFLALTKGYYLNLGDFISVDSAIFLKGINLFSVSDDAVYIEEEGEDFYSNSQTINNDLTMN